MIKFDVTFCVVLTYRNREQDKLQGTFELFLDKHWQGTVIPQKFCPHSTKYCQLIQSLIQLVNQVAHIIMKIGEVQRCLMVYFSPQTNQTNRVPLLPLFILSCANCNPDLSLYQMHRSEADIDLVMILQQVHFLTCQGCFNVKAALLQSLQ